MSECSRQLAEEIERTKRRLTATLKLPNKDTAQTPSIDSTTSHPSNTLSPVDKLVSFAEPYDSSEDKVRNFRASAAGC